MQRKTYSTRPRVGKSFASAVEEGRSAHKLNMTGTNFTISPNPTAVFIVVVNANASKAHAMCQLTVHALQKAHLAEIGKRRKINIRRDSVQGVS
jgi:hypothetical protein